AARVGRAARPARGRGRGGLRAHEQQSRRLRPAERADPARPPRRGRDPRDRWARACPRRTAGSGRMNVLAVVHGSDAPVGSFGDVVVERGHRLATWVPVVAATPPDVEAHDAVVVFGGAMHVDQEADHPWLREEEEYFRALLDRGVPLLGVCLGAQMVAKAAGARVGPALEPEIGWYDVERSGSDPVLGVLPGRFPAFQWH